MQWYVDPRGGRDVNDGRSLKTAFRTLQQASQVAKAGDTVSIAAGAYDQDLPHLIAGLRAANVVVSVVGSDQ